MVSVLSQSLILWEIAKNCDFGGCESWPQLQTKVLNCGSSFVVILGIAGNCEQM